MSNLYDHLTQLYMSDEYPMHMPGHKRQDTGTALDASYHIDITEIEGYDNLYDAHGILRDAMNYAGSLYDCPHTYYLVNGATIGILIAVRTVADMYARSGRRGRLLAASNCHRSVHAGAELSGLDIDVIYPTVLKIPGIDGAVAPADIEDKLRKAQDEGYGYAGVIITSPTYEGIISDIETIADICHRYDTVLIVDEAHGAHLDLSDAYPGGALRYGADIVIHSTHKTLAAMTQTALLHIRDDLVDITIAEKVWSSLQTSSPSYVLMASIDNALHHIEEHPEMIREHLNIIGSLRDRLTDIEKGLKNLRLFTEADITDHSECVAIDPYKIAISTAGIYIDGYCLHKILLEDYHIQMEMAAKDYVLGITTYMDTAEGLERMAEALLEIDDRIGDRYYNIDDTKGDRDGRYGYRSDLYAPCIPTGLK